MRKLMDDATSVELNNSLQDMIKWLFCEPNPIAINTALMMTKAVKPNFRLPYCALTKEQRQVGFGYLAQLKQADLIGDSLELLADSDFNYCD